MISFKILTKEVKEELLDEIEVKTPGADFHLAEMNLDIFLNRDDDIEYAVSHYHGCLLFRIFDGEYSFLFPLPLRDDSDPVGACSDICDYAVKEEIPLVFLDVEVEELGRLLSMFRHANIDSCDPDNRFYTVRVMSEAALLDGIPTLVGEGDMKLSPITSRDDEIYARLCKDEDTNKYWGYDYSRDEPDPDDVYFRETAESEFSRGVSICMAVRIGGVFAGEATLYAFDLRGGCECAIRLLPAFRHKGYATEGLKLLRELAENLGLVYLCATVYAENVASVRLTQKVLQEQSRQDGIVKFKSLL